MDGTGISYDEAVARITGRSITPPPFVYHRAPVAKKIKKRPEYEPRYGDSELDGGRPSYHDRPAKPEELEARKLDRSGPGHQEFLVAIVERGMAADHSQSKGDVRTEIGLSTAHALARPIIPQPEQPDQQV